eukprot:3163476-Pyramimonas_sp.AAC.1
MRRRGRGKKPEPQQANTTQTGGAQGARREERNARGRTEKHEYGTRQPTKGRPKAKNPQGPSQGPRAFLLAK